MFFPVLISVGLCLCQPGSPIDCAPHRKAQPQRFANSPPRSGTAGGRPTWSLLHAKKGIRQIYIRKIDPEILSSYRFFLGFLLFAFDFPRQSLRKSRPWSNFTGFLLYSWGVSNRNSRQLYSDLFEWFGVWDFCLLGSGSGDLPWNSDSTCNFLPRNGSKRFRIQNPGPRMTKLIFHVFVYPFMGLGMSWISGGFLRLSYDLLWCSSILRVSISYPTFSYHTLDFWIRNT